MILPGLSHSSQDYRSRGCGNRDAIGVSHAGARDAIALGSERVRGCGWET